MNKLQAMEVFVQVVDAGGFTRAAENMQMPKATVSTLIQSLETALSVKLLNRTTRQINVTADGAAYYERCLRILSDVREAEESLSHARQSPSGRLRVDAGTGMASGIIIPALPAFFDRYPDIVQTSVERPSSRFDRRRHRLRGARRQSGRLQPDRAARRRHQFRHLRLARLYRRIRPADTSERAGTASVCQLFFVEDRQDLQLGLHARGRTDRPADAGKISLNDSNAYISAGLAGLGVMQMARYTLEPYLADGRLLMILEDWLTDPLPIHVV